MKKEKPTDVETWNLYKEITGRIMFVVIPLDVLK
jgi:hypothetical protein